MVALEALDDDAEVSGEFVDAVVSGLGVFSDRYRKGAVGILAEESIEDIDGAAWYPQQSWLDGLERIVDNVRPTVVERVGEQIPEFTDWPHDIDTVSDALRSIDEEYQRLHRGGDIGYYGFTYVEEQCGELTAFNPHPCALDRGLVRGIASKHAPRNASVALEETGSGCRDDGDGRCTYTVYW